MDKNMFRQQDLFITSEGADGVMYHVPSGVLKYLTGDNANELAAIHTRYCLRKSNEDEKVKYERLISSAFLNRRQKKPTPKMQQLLGKRIMRSVPCQFAVI